MATEERNYLMTQRSIRAGEHPTVIVKAGASVMVRGEQSDIVTAETSGMWGLKVEKRPENEIGRARAAIGEHVLFDLHLKRPGRTETGAPDDVIEVQIGASGEVLVPRGSNLKIYSGLDIDVQDVQGIVDAYSGRKLNMHNVNCVGNASAGGAMNLECQTMLATTAECKAGSDLRFLIRDLHSARLQVKDLGGYWEALIGAGEKSVTLKCGGDVTLVTDQKVEPLPPNYVLGKIEKPSVA
jgi:hypothetical protein